MADASTFPTAAEADAALAAAQATLASAEADYEAELELALNTCVAEWQALRSNAGKSPEALNALLRAIAETGELPECDNGALSVFMEKFSDRRESLAAVRAEAKSAYDVSLARHKAQALQRSRALRARELAQLQAVYPEYARVEGEDPQVQVDRLAGLLEHTVIAQRLLERVDGLALGMEQLGARMVSLEAAAATAKAAAARPAWAARMRRADADLLLAAHAGDFDAAEAALAAGADVNCANQFAETALHFVARLCDDKSDKAGDHLAIAALLVSKGGDLTLKDNGEQTPLVVAELSGSAKMKNVLNSQKVVYVECLKADLRSPAKPILVRAQASLLRLMAIAAIDAARAEASFPDIFEAVALAMNAHLRSAELQASACSWLAELAKGDAAMQKAVAAGAIEAVAAAMSAHPHNEKVQLSSLRLLALATHTNDIDGWVSFIFGVPHGNKTEYEKLVKALQLCPVRIAKSLAPAATLCIDGKAARKWYNGASWMLIWN